MGAARGFGVDIGGSGIKGCEVDLDAGALVGDRLRIPTPEPSTPDAVAEVVAEIVERFGWTGPVGVTLPAVVKRGVAHSAANIDKGWIGTDAAALFAKRLGRPEGDVVVLNDADAAGIAEINYGRTDDREGVVVLLTFGTGIGSALFLDGRLVPNTEFGHLEIDGHDAETRAAASVKEEKDLSWEEWARRVSRYVSGLENLIWPDLIIAGGGVSKKADKWLPLLDVRTKVVAAQLRNDAGIVGAAYAARQVTGG
ncbi:polyphosphate--glucose phosphotransferase [Actinokineospora globicatena]|uniref:Polyphosphate glucokinase n=1 Tax=Actinokineospora globicatena TaxID=103729 RepID=A0A9W6QMY3_9PSEU|nr:ROK family protein [Actinokineospora globicatena]MCP2302648.1 Polyphosphate glucokinase [Actinokineospora globicatena]GLW75664.1 polyphosphate glucokinase [Actinokineospora globicatena]GLW82504.1 polyphosphate glucokinase [Actinokineospora globicatena]GLW91449.1 polyphosphate glucokinase [Actinokineospora globicatena]